jgi:hypothetical protein
MATELTLKVAIVDAAREYLHAQLFKAFRLKLRDGKTLRVKTPDDLTVTRGGWIIYDDGKTQRILNPAMVASVDVPSSALR